MFANDDNLREEEGGSESCLILNNCLHFIDLIILLVFVSMCKTMYSLSFDFVDLLFRSMYSYNLNWYSLYISNYYYLW